MTLSDLYVEGLTQRALRGPDHLNAYKLGVIEAILKAALRGDDAPDAEALRAHVRDALEVARWEPPRPRSPGSRGAGGT